MSKTAGSYSGKNLEEMSFGELKKHYKKIWRKIDELSSESEIGFIQYELRTMRDLLVEEHGWSRGDSNKLVGQEGSLDFPEVDQE